MNQNSNKFNISARWTPKLGQQFCPVSSFFLANYHRLTPFEGAKSMNTSEAMLVIQILDHKWTEKAPFPAVGTLAKRMAITPRAVRNYLKSLEERGYVRREYRSYGKTTLYHLEGLYQALEALMDADQQTKAAAQAETPEAA